MRRMVLVILGMFVSSFTFAGVKEVTDAVNYQRLKPPVPLPDLIWTLRSA